MADDAVEVERPKEKKRSRRDDDDNDDIIDVDVDDVDDESSSSSSWRTPRRIGNSIDFPLTNLRPHLLCTLCHGYYRDPYTVADCLHTFCRSCLILFFRQGMRCCPTCATRLGPDPFQTSISIHNREVMPDRTLQEIVHKIFPWMKAQEEDEERNFYLHRGIELKPEYQTTFHSKQQQMAQQQTEAAGEITVRTNKKNKRNNDDADTHVDDDDGDTNAMQSTASMDVKNDDQIDVLLNTDIKPPHAYQQLPPLKNARITISSRAKIGTLKKYLIMKLGLKDTCCSISASKSKLVSSSSSPSPTMIELTCNGETMEDELTLMFILRTKWFTSNKVLTLKYRLLHQVKVKATAEK
jgi:hypothetical protein